MDTQSQEKENSKKWFSVQFFLSFICIILLGAGTLMFSPLVIPYTLYLGGAQIHGPLIEGISKIIAAFGVIYVGHMSSIWGRRKTLVFIYFFGFTGIFSAGMAINPFWLLIASTITSLSFASMSAVMMTYLLEIAPANRKGMAMGIFGTGIGFSSVFGALLGTNLAELFGLRAPFFIAGIGPLLAALLVYFFFLENKASPPIRKISGIYGLKLFPVLIKAHFLLLYLYIGALAYQFVQSSLSTLLTPLIQHLGYPLSIVGICIGAFGIFGLLQPIGGRIGDSIGRKKTVVFGSLLFFLGMLTIFRAESHIAVIIGTSLFGIGTSLYVPCITAEVGTLSPQGMRGAAMGLYQSMITLGSIIGPVAGGAFLEYVGPRGPFLLNSILTGLVLVIFIFVKWYGNMGAKS